MKLDRTFYGGRSGDCATSRIHASVLAFFLVADEGGSERDDDTACGCVEHLNESDDKSIDSRQQPEVSTNLGAAQATDRATEVSCRQKKERDPQQKKDAPDCLAQAEGHDPQQEGEHAPHQKRYRNS